MHWEAFDSGHSICELILFRILKLSSSTLVHLLLWWFCTVVISNIQYSGVTLVVHLIYWWHTDARLVDGGGKKGGGGRHSGTQFPQWKKPEAPSLSRSNYRVGKYGLNRFITIWQVPILRNSTYIRITIMASLTSDQVNKRIISNSASGSKARRTKRWGERRVLQRVRGEQGGDVQKQGKDSGLHLKFLMMSWLVTEH